MNSKTKIILASIFTVALLSNAQKVNAQETKVNCQPVYGGGEICGAYTPAPTGLETGSILFASAGLYSTGMISFVLSQKIGKLLPKS